MQRKSIVVTGAAGCIGSALVRHLNDQGRENLILVDRLGTDDRWQNLRQKRFLDVVHADQLFDWLQRYGKEVSAVIHLGACSSTVERDADFLLENNYRYSTRLAEWAFSHDVRLIYASSAATYGDGSLGFSDAHEKLDQLCPLNMYGFSKHLFDLWLLRKNLLSRAVGLKYFNVFGPNEGHKGRMRSAVVKMLESIQERGEVQLFRSSEPGKFGDGEQMRDFIYVKDAVRMTAAFLENDAGGIFNVATGRARTWNDLAKAVFSALDLSPNITYIPMPEDLVGRYQNYTEGEMEKTAEVLGEEATCKALEESVQDYVCAHLQPERAW